MKTNCTNSLRLVLPAIMAILCFASAASTTASAATPAQPGAAASPAVTPLNVDRADPASDRIVPAHVKLERIATGFTWVEGPVWVNNSLFFADIPSNTIRRWTPGKGVSIFLQPSGYKGASPYGGREPGSNGMTLDASGRLTVAGHAQRDIFRFESLNPESVQTVLADRYQGLRLNSPNDLVYRSDGSVYFTDPPYGLRKQNDSDPEKDLKINGVYRIPHAADQKAVTNPANTQTSATVTCPAKTVVLSGGTFSSSDSASVQAVSLFPASQTKFTGRMDNATSSDATLQVQAVCGHKPAKYDTTSNLQCEAQPLVSSFNLGKLSVENLDRPHLPDCHLKSLLCC